MTMKAPKSMVAWLLVLGARAETITVVDHTVGTTPVRLGYNLGHFMPGTNAADWFRYSGVDAARVFISVSDSEPIDDLAPVGDGVTDEWPDQPANTFGQDTRDEAQDDDRDGGLDRSDAAQDRNALRALDTDGDGTNDDLDTDDVSATLRDGVLRVEIRKSERVQPRKIAVRAE